MKLKEVFYLLGFQPKIKKYSCAKVSITLPEGKLLHWAAWQHPKAKNLKPDLESIAFFKKLLQEGDVCIDIGAHVGDTTMAPALVLGKKGLVIAMEPNESTYEVLIKNIEFNRENVNILPLKAAAMENEGTYEFRYNEPGLFNGGAQEGIRWHKHASAFKIDVKGINLVNYIRTNMPEAESKIKFIKTDTEGHDYSVFKSLRPIFEKCRPVLQCEIGRNTLVDDRNGLFGELFGMDYRIFKLAKDYPSSVRTEVFKDDVKFLPARQTYDILAAPMEKMDLIL